MKIKEKKQEFINCPYCDYNNKKENVERYGTCTRCHEILDKKAKFDKEMFDRLRLWRGKKWD